MGFHVKYTQWNYRGTRLFHGNSMYSIPHGVPQRLSMENFLVLYCNLLAVLHSFILFIHFHHTRLYSPKSVAHDILEIK